MKNKAQFGLVSMLLMAYVLCSSQLVYPLVDAVLPSVVITNDDDYFCAGHNCCCDSKESCESHCCCQKDRPPKSSRKTSENPKTKQLSIKAIMACNGTLPSDTDLRVLPLDLHHCPPPFSFKFYFSSCEANPPSFSSWKSWIRAPMEHVPRNDVKSCKI